MGHVVLMGLVGRPGAPERPHAARRPPPV